MKKRTFDFKIGADPELLLFRDGSQVGANQALQAIIGKTLPSRTMGFQVGKAGDIGWDGAGTPAEIRPTATSSIAKLTANIGRLLAQLHTTLRGIDITTLSLNARAGGHIQVDIPEAITKDAKVFNRITILMATFVLPLFASDHMLSSNYRRQSYGDADDFRTERRGKVITFEIRGPSAEWLASPKLTAATLAYIGVVWTEILKHHETLIKHPKVFKNLEQIDSLQDGMLTNYAPLQTMLLKSVKQIVRTFERYNDFKDEIEFILSPGRVLAHKQAIKWLPKNGWGFPSPKTPTKKEFTKIEEDGPTGLTPRSKEALDSFTKNVFGMAYNDDLKISSLVQAIAHRLFAQGITLKHTYFLFGVKRHTKGFLIGQAESDEKGKFTPSVLAKPEDLLFRDAIKTISRMGKNITARRQKQAQSSTSKPVHSPQ